MSSGAFSEGNSSGFRQIECAYVCVYVRTCVYVCVCECVHRVHVYMCVHVRVMTG